MSIISHSKKFIFLKTRKTAGTSISVTFASVCAPEDVLALSQDVVDKTGIQRRNIIRSVNSLSARSIVQHCYLIWRNIGRLGSLETLLPVYRQHMKAAEIKEAVGESVWRDYYKFTIERNPYDRLVSFYNWRKHRFNLDICFEDFASAVLCNDAKFRKYTYGFSNRPFYLNKDNHICVNKVILYEDIQNGVEEVFSALGVDLDKAEIPSFKSGIRKEKSYQRLYSDALRKKAEEAFSLEYELFGYEF